MYVFQATSMLSSDTIPGKPPRTTEWSRAMLRRRESAVCRSLRPRRLLLQSSENGVHGLVHLSTAVLTASISAADGTTESSSRLGKSAKLGGKTNNTGNLDGILYPHEGMTSLSQSSS